MEWTIHKKGEDTHTGIGVYRYPTRKSVALMLEDPGCSTPLAYFRSEYHAELFIKRMEFIVEQIQGKRNNDQ